MRTRSSPDRVDPFLLWRYHFSLIRRGWKFEDFAKGRHHLGTHQVLQFSLCFLLNRYRAVRSCRRNQVNVCRSQKARNGEHSESDCCACGPFSGSRKLLLYLIVTEILVNLHLMLVTFFVKIKLLQIYIRVHRFWEWNYFWNSSSDLCDILICPSFRNIWLQGDFSVIQVAYSYTLLSYLHMFLSSKLLLTLRFVEGLVLSPLGRHKL